MSYSSTVLADSPWAYYRLDETSGTTINDSSGNSRTATGSSSGITYSQTGALAGDSDTAMLFNGSTGVIVLPTSNPFTGSSGWSAECWVKVASLPASGHFYNFLSLGTCCTADQSIQILFTGSASGKIQVSDTNTAFATWGTIPSTNTWYHVVVTYVGGSSSAITLYVNGSSQGSSNVTLALPSSVGPEVASYNHGNYAPATIDEVAFYSSALSSTRVLAHYNAGITAGTTHSIISDGFGGVFQ